MEKYNMVVEMMKFEEGNLSDRRTIRLFSKLIKTGTVWKLQGFYGRCATTLINQGYITKTGQVTELGRSL